MGSRLRLAEALELTQPLLTCCSKMSSNGSIAKVAIGFSEKASQLSHLSKVAISLDEWLSHLWPLQKWGSTPDPMGIEPMENPTFYFLKRAMYLILSIGCSLHNMHSSQIKYTKSFFILLHNFDLLEQFFPHPVAVI